MVFTYSTQKIFLCRLHHGVDLLEEIHRICREQEITVGRVSIIGAVQSAKVGYYHQAKREYETLSFPGPLEIATCAGNISVKEDAPFAHLHILLSDSNAAVKGGHLMPGTIIFAAEACIESFEGEAPVRGADPVTGLYLWERGKNSK